jgi:cyclopropane fatty-acyl-phospholipid synthase-like methyltransferase
VRRQISAILAQAYRRRLVLGLLQSIDSRERERILDIGSGTGALAADLRRRFPAADIVGIELSREGVERARIAVPIEAVIQPVCARLRGRRATPKTSYPFSSKNSARTEPSWPPIPITSARFIWANM